MIKSIQIDKLDKLIFDINNNYLTMPIFALRQEYNSCYNYNIICSC